MTLVGWLQILLILATVVAFAVPLGAFLSKVFSGERNCLTPVLGPVERGFYRIAGVDPAREQGWLAYTLAMLAFNAAGFALLYAILRVQAVLPLNPQGFPGLSAHLAFNTAVSFVTNTNWQSYGGETTLSLLSQMAGLTVQNFLSAATGMALAVALVRAFARSGAQTVGNVFVVLLRNAGKVVTHTQILREVWGSANEHDTQYLRVYVGQLRQKLEDDPAAPRLILTEPGIGYRLV